MIADAKQIIILTLLQVVVYCWFTFDDVRTGNIFCYLGRVLIIESPTTQFVASDNKLSFNISYSSDLATNPITAGLGITGLDTLVTNDLAVNLTI